MGASGQTNWRVSQSFYDWTMDIEKRVMHEERRKPIPPEGQTYVDGLGAQSVRVYDWNDAMPQRNGYWFSEPGAINSPDPTNLTYWMGHTSVDDLGDGIQWVTSYRPPDDATGEAVDEPMTWPQPTWMRRFYFDEDAGQTVFGPWEQETGGGQITQVLRNVGTRVRTTNTNNSTSIYNISTFTIPVELATAGTKFRVTGMCAFNPDTAGTWTELVIKVGQNASTGGIVVADSYVDHRIVGRTVTAVAVGEYVYQQAEGASNINFVLVGEPHNGGSFARGDPAIPIYLIVDQIVEESIGAVATEGGGGGPSTPTGPAGGDLTGTYPNPQIAANAITATKIAADTIAYTFVQGSPVAVWSIVHPLAFRPNVTVVDSAGSQVEGDVQYTATDTITVTFSAAFSGTAYLS